MKGTERYLQGLNDEIRAKVLSCETTEDMLKVAREEGLELPDEALYAVYGGCGTSYTYEVDDWYNCNTCKNKVQLKSVGHDGFPNVYYCPTCLVTRDGTEIKRYYNRRKVKK